MNEPKILKIEIETPSEKQAEKLLWTLAGKIDAGELKGVQRMFQVLGFLTIEIEEAHASTLKTILESR